MMSDAGLTAEDLAARGLLLCDLCGNHYDKEAGALLFEENRADHVEKVCWECHAEIRKHLKAITKALDGVRFALLRRVYARIRRDHVR